MKRNLLFFIISATFVLGSVAAVAGQSGPAATTVAANGVQGQPVSYASVTQLNGLLGQLETISKNTQTDLGKLKIEKWKASGSDKKQALAYVDSIQRNLQGAVPEMISQLRNTPEDLPASFKLYRNLEALYPVLDRIAEGAQMFGSKDDVQAISNDLNGLDGTRKQLAERIENLSSSKESELERLRTQLKALQAQVDAAPPKKIVVDDNEPPKKPAPKKKSTKPAGTTTPSTTKPAAGQAQTPPAQQPPQ